MQEDPLAVNLADMAIPVSGMHCGVCVGACGWACLCLCVGVWRGVAWYVVSRSAFLGLTYMTRAKTLH